MMLLSPDSACLLIAATALKSGSLVSYPTDTYFALGADGSNSRAVEHVFEVKGRNPGTPVPLLLSDLNMATELATVFPDVAADLASRFWPGALTIVLPASDDVPEAVDARALHDRILTFDAEMDYPPDFMEGAKDAGTTAI